MIFLFVLFVLAVIILASCVKVVPQAEAYVVERLGAYQATWGVGLRIKLSFIDKIARKVDLKGQVADFAPQPVVT